MLPIYFLTTSALLIVRALAQSSCTGTTSTYSKDGLNISFKNLCGKDITAVVDFDDPTNEGTWDACLAKCVEKAPLCYGFDFTPLGNVEWNCWLMRSNFSESTALPQSYTVDAAMLTPEFLADLSSDCRELGLQGCFKKNGAVSTGISSSFRIQATSSANLSPTGSGSSVTSTPSSTPTSSTTEALDASPKSGGLSTAAKAGIGAGVAIFCVSAIIMIIVLYIKLQKARQQNASNKTNSYASDATAVQGRSELPSPDARYSMAELQSANQGFGAEKYGNSGSGISSQIHELDGVARVEKP